LFCRWDDGRERFNIETACAGMDSKPDALYRQWPHPSTEAEIRAEGYLKSLSPAEELGVFLQLRAMCLLEHRRVPEAAAAFRLALRAFPTSRLIRQQLYHLEGSF
jgi:hypothetical protein